MAVKVVDVGSTEKRREVESEWRVLRDLCTGDVDHLPLFRGAFLQRRDRQTSDSTATAAGRPLVWIVMEV